MKPQFATEYTCIGTDWAAHTRLRCLDKTLTQQQFKDECDINVLFARYLESGEMPQVQEGLTYDNFEGIYDFQTAMNAVRTAEGLFSQFPARIKNRFDNDPQKMLQFLADENNREEAEFLGLLNKEQTNDEPGTHGTGSSLPTTREQENKAGTGGTPNAEGQSQTTQKP